MKPPVVFIGIGEMGSVFARGFLRLGHPVYPLTREMDIDVMAAALPDPELVMVAVAEGELHAILENIPPTWHDRIALLQNELLPEDWQRHKLKQPTIISVWFEKKKGQDSRVIIPSPAYGPRATLLQQALATLGIPCRILASEDELLRELVLKNVYILTSNIAGLRVGGSVGELWEQHQTLATGIANEVMDIQQALTGTTLPRAELINGMVEAFRGDLEHKCMGRSAPARLQRAIRMADTYGLAVPRMREIQASMQAS